MKTKCRKRKNKLTVTISFDKLKADEKSRKVDARTALNVALKEGYNIKCYKTYGVLRSSYDEPVSKSWEFELYGLGKKTKSKKKSKKKTKSKKKSKKITNK